MIKFPISLFYSYNISYGCNIRSQSPVANAKDIALKKYILYKIAKTSKDQKGQSMLT